MASGEGERVVVDVSAGDLGEVADDEGRASEALTDVEDFGVLDVGRERTFPSGRSPPRRWALGAAPPWSGYAPDREP